MNAHSAHPGKLCITLPPSLRKRLTPHDDDDDDDGVAPPPIAIYDRP
jgi:hypothetical protein